MCVHLILCQLFYHLSHKNIILCFLIWSGRVREKKKKSNNFVVDAFFSLLFLLIFSVSLTRKELHHNVLYYFFMITIYFHSTLFLSRSLLFINYNSCACLLPGSLFLSLSTQFHSGLDNSLGWPQQKWMAFGFVEVIFFFPSQITNEHQN